MLELPPFPEEIQAAIDAAIALIEWLQNNPFPLF